MMTIITESDQHHLIWGSLGFLL